MTTAAAMMATAFLLAFIALGGRRTWNRRLFWAFIVAALVAAALAVLASAYYDHDRIKRCEHAHGLPVGNDCYLYPE